MTLEQCKNSWNYMYEWRGGLEWFPCHVFDDSRTDEDYICVFTRNGTIMRRPHEEVRKMSEENYINQRNQYLPILGTHYEEYGYHELLEEDLEMFRKV